ncbi:hypothetical protein E2R48_07995 [Histophilus somni]|uniref:Outer membrane protein beta-barrel domain-containing protein n=2 Tax=Histophilus somni TaxID=731 RepID=A0AAX2S1F9_HISSO|nr:hypothetical protein E1290_05355 [Histophilus somni]TEW28916.1 hypothetical protein E2R48_07995 [Histophilus somni]
MNAARTFPCGGGNFNFYGKAGIDLTSRFETMKITQNYDSAGGFKLSIPASSRQNTFSPSIFFETTYNIFPQTEIGLGLGYIKRKGFDHIAIWPVRGGAEYDPSGQFHLKETYRVNRYASLPIYFILKQNYALNANTKFYLKGDLGYSINKIRKTVYTSYGDIGTTAGVYEESYKFVSNNKAKSGLYLGLGIGIEYKSFLVDIGYYHTHSKITYKEQESYVSTPYNNDAIRLTLGFKF